MFRWATVTALFFGLGVIVLNTVNKSTYQKAAATDGLVFISATEDLVAQVGKTKQILWMGIINPKLMHQPQ